VQLPASLRAIVANRGLTSAVVATLAAGTAALTIVFGIVNAALYRPPPFHEAGRLAMLHLVRDDYGVARRERWSYARIQLLRAQQRSFAQLANYTPASLTLAGEPEAELVRAEFVSADYFALLGTRASHGRTFAGSEDDAQSPGAVVVLGQGLADRRFGGASAILGRTVRLNGTVVTVIGVIPAGFRGLSGVSELWLPAPIAASLTYAGYVTTNQNFISVVGRLRHGVSLSAAQNELALLGGSINRALPSDPDRPNERVTAAAVSLNDARIDRTVRRSLLILLGAVALLHLLAMVNATNLLLGRAVTRRHESAVRAALGSSRARLFRHVLAEGLVMAGMAGLLGVAIASLTSDVIAPPANVWAPRNFYGSLAAFDAPRFGGAELVFGMTLAAVTALLVAIVPAFTAFGIDVAAGLRAGARGLATNTPSLRRPSLRGLIVGLEAALAMVLVIAAGLLIESFQRIRRTSVGVDAAHVLTFWIIPSEARVPPAAAPAFVSRVLEAVTRVPGVVGATVDGGAPMAGTASSVLHMEGRPAPVPGQEPPVLRHYIAPDHFRVMGIPLVRGRAFTESDVAGAPRVTIISAGAARRFWPDEDPIGRRVWFGGGSSFSSRDSSAEIVGIVGDVVYAPVDQRPNAASFYTPYAQFTYASRMVFVRTTRDPLSIVPDVRRAVSSVDPELALRDVQPLEDVVSGSWARHRFDAFLFGAFGMAALLLAATGIFAVVAHAVANRTREFGIRIALGAATPMMLRLVISEGMVFPVLGLVAGAAGAAAATRVLASSLYEVSPVEPSVYLLTAGMLLVVTVAACLAPAWRATRADPIVALRAD
jgi:predicted permease